MRIKRGDTIKVVHSHANPIVGFELIVWGININQTVLHCTLYNERKEKVTDRADINVGDVYWLGDEALVRSDDVRT